MLLSLSHDIKTPLSAIKLGARALARGLYRDEGKRRAAAESINTRADEIERFVSEITKAASEDFMSFEVKQGEAFLSYTGYGKTGGSLNQIARCLNEYSSPFFKLPQLFCQA